MQLEKQDLKEVTSKTAVGRLTFRENANSEQLSESQRKVGPVFCVHCLGPRTKKKNRKGQTALDKNSTGHSKDDLEGTRTISRPTLGIDYHQFLRRN